MGLTDTDRRRFVAAAALTLLALPALWLANTTKNSSAPTVAVAGIDPAVEVGTSATEASGQDSAEIGEDAPVFLGGPASPPGAGLSEIAIPAKPLVDGITANATFRSTVPSTDTCIVSGLANGTLITVVNLDNNRSVSCTTILAPVGSSDDVVLHTSAFAEIADLTDAPISVEIRR